ncbi:MAG: hypothetical protein IPI32_06535 [Austwickia sp.]|jgi:hypothetical protein|nr:hypothetical protein [Austwickia sp.]MBK8437283.1 hypothetical protein [Austwickia sp.]MBK9102517.1 hypothetical protein [Austwickia sp.]
MDTLKRLAAANPSPDGSTEELDSRARDDLARILASHQPRTLARSARTAVRRPYLLLAATIGACLALLAFLFMDPRGVTSRPAYAVTPPQLVIVSSGETTNVSFDRLIACTKQKADATESQRESQFADWSLWSRVDTGDVHNAVAPTEHQVKWLPDRSGKSIVRWGRPWVPSPSVELTMREGDLVREETFRTGEFHVMFPEPPPSDPNALYRYLSVGHPISEQSTPELIAAVRDLRMEWRTSRVVNGAVLELLRRKKDLQLAGTAVDRLGRIGTAFIVNHRQGGLPTRTTLVFDATGNLLTVEETLTVTPGKLNVAIPATISYVAFR